MEELIRKYVTLSTHANNKGWFTTKCAVCHDYKVRGGFLLSDSEVAYNCFNCGCKSIFYKNSHISDQMMDVLLAFNIPKEEIQKIQLANLGKTPTKKTVIIKDDNPIVELPLPQSFYRIKTDGSDVWSNVAIEYLEQRGIVNDDNFFLSLGKTSAFEKKWYGRLIIPFYRDGKLIFYQGRSFLKTKQRYENSMVTGDGVILYGYNRLHTDIDEPLFITEGFFDCYHLKGVAINGGDLSPAKIKVINQSRRRKIYIPDRYGNGKSAALSAINAGWEVSIPDTGDCKDINQSIIRFGYMFVYMSLLQNAKKGFEAKVAVNLLCKD